MKASLWQMRATKNPVIDGLRRVRLTPRQAARVRALVEAAAKRDPFVVQRCGCGR